MPEIEEPSCQGERAESRYDEGVDCTRRAHWTGWVICFCGPMVQSFCEECVEALEDGRTVCITCDTSMAPVHWHGPWQQH